MRARSLPSPVVDPTPRQTEILEFIRQTLTESGAPPTRDEISQAFGFRSLNAAEQHLQALQKKGLIELVAGTSRGIRLKGQRARANAGIAGKRVTGDWQGLLREVQFWRRKM